ncbi:MAG: Myo-inositol 2-dehydrogenase [Nitrospirae bacterium]|nr:Myo-inositol 2-dehydrogenase [Nitrospirota bacterium]MCK6492652.1 Gfo/Idh/MocA family oxidoreductase [Nitrospira sp.]MEB2337277.1 Gfo/Idh/MocA family oxidoreductase [Nitrospirales bacterium]QOJ36656.1 MAG: Gfo/Idh/MocA family oxidoreductase [Nitrospira sp.]
MTTVTVGIVGTGFGAQVHLPAFRRLSAVTVAGIAGQDRDKTARVAQAQGVPTAYGSWQALIDDKKIEAVVIAVPPRFHCEMVLRALEAGKHVLCEKPFGVDPVEAASMLEKARHSDLVCMVDYQFRMAPERIRLKELLEAGAIGRVRRVTVEWTVRGRAAGNRAWSWQFDPTVGGGVLFAFGSHVVDYLQWLMGPAKSVTAHLSTRGGPAVMGPDARPAAADTLDGILLLQDDIPASITISNATPGGRGHWLTVYGERGALVVGNPNQADAVIGTCLYESDPTTGVLREVPVSAPSTDGLSDGRTLLVGRLAETFASAIRAGTPTAPSFEDGWRAQVVMQAMREAHERRRWMPVDMPGGRGRSWSHVRRTP